MSRPRCAVALCAVLLLVLGGAGAAAAKKKKKEKKRQYTVGETMSKKLTAAIEHIEEEQYEAARELMAPMEKRAKRLNPYERALTFQILGFVESSQERYPEALSYFEKCLVEDALPKGTQDSTRFNVAQLYLATEQFAKAAETLELWFEEVESPTSTAYYLLAVSYYQMQELDRAIPPAEQAVEKAKVVKESWLQLLAGLYFEKQRYADAVVPLEQLVTLFPKKSYWVQLSALYAQGGEEEKSLAVLQLAYQQGFLELDRELRQLAQRYMAANLPYRAALVMEKALAEGKVESDAESWELLANSWIMARELERALEPLTKAAELAEDGGAYVRVGQLHLQREKWSDASEAFTKALEKGELDDVGTVNLLLGISFYRQEQRERAREYFGMAKESESSEKSAKGWLKLMEQESRRG